MYFAAGYFLQNKYYLPTTNFSRAIRRKVKLRKMAQILMGLLRVKG